MKILVTGAAGFIGSSLCERLLEDANVEVVGIDAFVGPTPKTFTSQNLDNLLKHQRFTFLQENLLEVAWEKTLEGIEYVYHLAGMPGVRSSWGEDFQNYVAFNILATQRLLEACRHKPLKKFIYASTSSVYGEKRGKVSEELVPEPLSPYGITKLTGEYLCRVYHKSFRVPIVILRYFTVYGPRQRSDMAFHRFIHAMQQGMPVTIFGDGAQTRDFTYIDDCVAATAAAMNTEGVVGETINIGGKQRASVLDVIALLEQILRQRAKVTFIDRAIGEPKHTWADISKAENLLKYQPAFNLEAGLKNEIDYIEEIYRS